jgi:hypothetical protein
MPNFASFTVELPNGQQLVRNIREGEHLIIGCSSKAHVQLPQLPGVSRINAIISFYKTIDVVPLSSQVKVNGFPIRVRSALEAMDQIQLGAVSITVGSTQRLK